MIFKVNSKLKGSLLLNSLKSPLMADAIVFIDENILDATDVRSAIEREILIPEKPNEYGKFIKHNVKMIITNKTDRILVMGEISLGPRESTLVDEKMVNHDHIRLAFAEKLIDVKTNKVSIVLPESQSPPIVNNDKNTQTEETQIEETVNEPETTATIWDFTEQKMKEAQKTPKTASLVNADEEKEEEESETDFIDKKYESKKKIVNKKKRNKITKKKSIKSKKKEKVSKTKKLKAVGEIRPETKAEDIVVEELDSRGNPIEKTSDILSSLITELNQPPEIDFVDKE